MSGIHTGAQWGLLHTAGGINLDAFPSLFALLEAVAYRAVTSYPAEKGGVPAGLAVLKEICADTIKVIEQDYTAAVTLPGERWPWIDGDTNILLQENLYYGFSDSGSIATAPGSEHGWKTEAECIEYLTGPMFEIPAEDISTVPENLGAAECVLTGRQFVEQLWRVSAKDEVQFFEYGNWS